MEFPDLGKHCSEPTCKQLDFLPITCDACKQDFCKDHFSYVGHKCPFAFKKDVQVPVCPLCNAPIPVKKGEIPDVVVGEHMDRDCTFHPGRNRNKAPFLKEISSLLLLCQYFMRAELPGLQIPSFAAVCRLGSPRHSTAPALSGRLLSCLLLPALFFSARPHPALPISRVFTHRCSKEGCRKKEMLQLACAQCHGNFCIQHRHPLDHSCQAGSSSASRGRTSTSRAAEQKPSGVSWLAQRLRRTVK